MADPEVTSIPADEGQIIAEYISKPYYENRAIREAK